jgi:predicted transcriptional regulator
MARRDVRVSETELEVLKILWESGSGTVREVHSILEERGRRWAYTTVLTLLQRLLAKKCVTSEARGVAHVYRPVVSRDELLARRLKGLADELCEGAATPLVMALVQSQRFSPDEIDQFRRLLDEVEPEAKPRRKGSRRK